MTKKISLIILFFCGFITLMHSQVDADILTSNKIEIDGKEFYLYEVQPKEGVYRVALHYGVAQQVIINANPGAEKGLKVGQIIRIPIIAGANSNIPELRSRSKFIHHKVERGQNLFFISRKYDVSVQDIIKLNPASEHKLVPGMELRVPYVEKRQTNATQDENYLYHTVRPKDNLFMLSKMYKVTVKSIVAKNPGLEKGVIRPGEVLRIEKNAENSSEESTLATKQVKQTTEELKVLEDSVYTYHRFKFGETVYALSKKYGVKEKEIITSNNITNVNDIRIGYILRIPKIKEKAKDKKPTKWVTDGVIIHVTKKRRESIEDIILKYKVSRTELLALNPEISSSRWKKLKRKTRVKVPNKVEKMIVEKPLIVKKKKKRLPNNILKQKDCHEVKDYDVEVNIAFLLPFYTTINDTINTITRADSMGVLFSIPRREEVIVPSTGIAREFYYGALLAIDSLKKMGVDVNVHTFDIMRYPNDTETIKEVLSNPVLKNVDIIFGPAHSTQIIQVADFCKANEIRMVLPFGENNAVLNDNPFVFSMMGENNMQYVDAISYLGKDFENTNIFVVKDSNESDRQSNFATLLKDEIYVQKMEREANIKFYELDFKRFGRNGIQRIMSRDRRNLVILPSKNQELFNTVLPNLYYLRNHKGIPVTMFGFPEWMSFMETNLEYLFGLNSICFNNYYTDYSNPEVLAFLKKYKRWYGAEPTINHSSGLLHPNNGIMGFDAVFYFGQAIANFGPAFEPCLSELKVDLLQSDFKFERINNWSGFMNNHLYFINFSDSFDVIPAGTN